MNIDVKTLKVAKELLEDMVDSPNTCKWCTLKNCHPETCNCWCHN